MDIMDKSYIKPTILLLDNTPDNLSLMNNILSYTCKVKVAGAGEKTKR